MVRMRIPFRIVDVFTDSPLAGNQLCVIPDPVEISSHQMHAIAREIGFSETTFVTEASGDHYAMRIFTPGGELPFAGHPSLGTAFVLVSEGRVTTPVTQSVLAGESPIEVDLDTGFARMQQFPPWFGPEVSDLGAVALAVSLDPSDLDPSLPPQLVGTGLPYLVIPAASDEAVARAGPNARALEPLLKDVEVDGCYLFSFSDGAAHARMFASGIGIVEDPATGSAAGPLGAYLFARGLIEDGHLSIRQGVEMGRPSTLHVDVEGKGDALQVYVGGGVARVARGEFDLPL
jgi:trans-2,3-dihydro-3-hydroxyanthranilate isomerase